MQKQKIQVENHYLMDETTDIFYIFAQFITIYKYVPFDLEIFEISWK